MQASRPETPSPRPVAPPPPAASTSSPPPFPVDSATDSWRAFLWKSVRGRLTLLVIAITVPAVLLVALLTAQAYRNERESVSRHLIATTRALSSLVDQQIGECETLLRGLATTAALERDDLAAFDARARSVLRAAHAENRWVVVLDPQGRMLVNTLQPAGAPLPRLDLPPEFDAAMRRGETFVSNVITGPVYQGHMIFIAIPVRRDGQLKYSINLAIRSSAFGDALNVAGVAPGSLVAVVDRAGVIAARSRVPERFVGTKMSTDFAAAIAGRSEHVLESVTLDDVPVLSAITRSPRSGWVVVVSAPRGELYASARRLAWLGLAICAGLLGVALAMTRSIGRALVREVDNLVRDTEVVGLGAVPPRRSPGLVETDFVARAMRRTAMLLGEKERDNAHLTAALQSELEKQRRAEESSRRLAAIVESCDDAIIGKTLEGIITSWNKGAVQIFGYTAPEILNRPVTHLIPPERHEEERLILEGVRRNQSVTALETLRRHKDGRLVPISLTVSPVVDRHGRVVGASTVARDITDQKRAERQQQALYELVARVNRAEALGDIFDAALDTIARCQDSHRAAILLADPAGIMRFQAARGLSEGYRAAVEGHSPWAPEEANPQPIAIDDVAAADLAPAIRQALAPEGIRALAFIPLTYEKKLLGKFMVYFDAPHRFEPPELRLLETIASQVAFAIARQQDAAALEALVDERTASLRQAVAQMQEFSYSVSHDLRAPVRAMHGYAEAIMESYGERLDAQGRDLLLRIQRNGARMDRLIQDLLTYTRVSRRDMNFERVSLEKLLNSVLEEYPGMQPDRADIAICGPLPEVLAHEPSLTQVMSNLLSNAVKFVPPGTRPRVRVGSENRSSRVRLWIEDNGIGIKPEHQSRLFGMFERVHPEKDYEGTGIGLAIVRKAVERMNGAVGVESDGVSGSRFWVELPVAPQN